MTKTLEQDINDIDLERHLDDLLKLSDRIWKEIKTTEDFLNKVVCEYNYIFLNNYTLLEWNPSSKILIVKDTRIEMEYPLIDAPIMYQKLAHPFLAKLIDKCIKGDE